MKRPIRGRAVELSGWLRSGESNRRTRTGLAMALLFVTSLASACKQPLPEANTAAAELYARRCGQCHHAYAPMSLTAAMWGIQVEMMEAKMRQSHLPPLTDQERDTILSYLTRNAEHH